MQFSLFGSWQLISKLKLCNRLKIEVEHYIFSSVRISVMAHSKDGRNPIPIGDFYYIKYLAICFYLLIYILG